MSIRTKLLGGFLGGWIGLSAVLLYVNVRHDRDARDRSDQIAADLISDVVANALFQSMSDRHKGADVQPLLNAIARGRGFRWAEVTNMQGKPTWAAGRVDTDRNTGRRLIAMAETSGAASMSASDGVIVVRLLPLQAVCLPCHSGTSRWVGAAMIEASVDPRLRRAQMQSNIALALLTLGAGGVGLIGVWILLNRFLVGPLSDMAARVGSITPGNWAAARIEPVPDGEVGVLATHFNRTLDRLAQAARERDGILSTALDGFAAVDLDGRILDVNDAYCQMHGYSRAELLTMTVADLSVRETPDDIRAHLQLVRSLGGDRFETRHRRKDGRLVDLEVSASHAGDARQFVFLRDITARRAAEDHMARSEAQLRQSQKMEAVGRLAGGIAHDFNNLLTAILGFAELALDRMRADDPGRSNIEEIQFAGARAAGLTRQMLAFSRKQVLDLQVQDVNSIATEMKNMLQRLIGENIELIVAADPWPARARVDRVHMEQVILNLTVNARDAMPTGGQLTIEVRTTRLTDPMSHTHGTVPAGRYVVLSVSDTGCGMSTAVQARLFEPFFTTKGPGKGTGLGLSTVYGIVTQISGHVVVSSAVGSGTCFMVYLPMDLTENGVDPDAAATPAAPTHVGTAVILLVEDDASVRQLTGQMLIHDGFTVLEAATGEDAMVLCRRYVGPIDLLLTDMVLPNMAGPEVAEQFVALRPETRVLFMSGYTEHALLVAHLADGGQTFIQKPFALATLIRKVRTALAVRPTLTD